MAELMVFSLFIQSIVVSILQMVKLDGWTSTFNNSHSFIQFDHLFCLCSSHQIQDIQE